MESYYVRVMLPFGPPDDTFLTVDANSASDAEQKAKREIIERDESLRHAGIRPCMLDAKATNCDRKTHWSKVDHGMVK